MVALDQIIRLDRNKVDPDIKEHDWENVIFRLFRKARKHIVSSGTFPGWQKVFLSIITLRKDNSKKLCSMYHSLQGNSGGTGKTQITDEWAADPTGGYKE